MNWCRNLLLLLVVVVSNGCLAKKLNSSQAIIEAHPKGFEDSVNGSFYRDGGEESERFMEALLRRVNELEEMIERGD